MKLGAMGWMAAALLATALVSAAPSTSEADGNRQHSRNPARQARDSEWRTRSRDWNSGGEDRWGRNRGGGDRFRRTYYYEDPYCHVTDAYLSNLTAHYDETGHPGLVYMVDRRSGQVLNTYARENDRWCKVSSGYTSIDAYGRGYARDHGRDSYADSWRGDDD